MNQVFGPLHPDTLSSAQNLGRDLREAYHYRESAEWLTATIGSTEAVDDDHIELLRAEKSPSVSSPQAG